MIYIDLKGNLSICLQVSEEKNAKSTRSQSLKKFLDWVEKSPFYGKNALAKAAEYTLNRANGLKAFLMDGRIEIDNNPAENAIRPNVIGRKNWLFSVSEAGAKANAICLSIAETAKSKRCGFLSIPCEVTDGSTESRYPSKPRNFKSIHALVKKYPSRHVENKK